MDKFIKHAHSHLMVKLSNSKLTAERVIITDCTIWNNDYQNLGSVRLPLCMWKKKNSLHTHSISAIQIRPALKLITVSVWQPNMPLSTSQFVANQKLEDLRTIFVALAT